MRFKGKTCWEPPEKAFPLFLRKNHFQKKTFFYHLHPIPTTVLVSKALAAVLHPEGNMNEDELPTGWEWGMEDWGLEARDDITEPVLRPDSPLQTSY